jgi:quaternary ammonium compound-resistance protein SugE
MITRRVPGRSLDGVPALGQSSLRDVGTAIDISSICNTFTSDFSLFVTLKSVKCRVGRASEGPPPAARGHIVEYVHRMVEYWSVVPWWGEMLMAWVIVIVAGLFETAFAVLLKGSANFTRLWPTIGFAVSALISFGLLNLALGKLEVGSAYAVWSGVGAAGTAIVGMLVLGESSATLKLVSIGLILAGVVGLNLSGVTP